MTSKRMSRPTELKVQWLPGKFLKHFHKDFCFDYAFYICSLGSSRIKLGKAHPLEASQREVNFEYLVEVNILIIRNTSKF